ncbi:uncharacterized protein LTR77_005172 [Saxophila tyrrhenica]|uniref:DUF8035 domain-containing protein n=1 Tax=Saxophila tyrrhenica TaxID=1690608 RepID=A0AAV9PDM1_9PEZI|nr:hypothetical protein LTR77_005172 [Saxophila tyrrhenica]
MSRYDRYDDRQSGVSRRPRNDRGYDIDLDVDIHQSRYDGPLPSRYDAPPARQREAMVKERDADVMSRRSERAGPRQPDFLREDYGRNPNAGPLVLREERFEEDDYVPSRPQRRRSLESVRTSRAPPPQRMDKEEIIIRERDNGGPPYPRSERGSFTERDDVSYRDRPRSRAPPPSNRDGYAEHDIDIHIHEGDRHERPPPPRSNMGGREEIRFRRGDEGPPPMRGNLEKREEITFVREERERPPPPREVEREEITFRDTVRSPPPREQPRGRGAGRNEELDIDIDINHNHSGRGRRTEEDIDIDINHNHSGRGRRTEEDIDIDINHNHSGRGRRTEEDIDINIRDRSAPPPRHRSQSRGVMVKKDHEEWVVRRRRTPSPSPSPPPRDFEREQIIIRRKERTPSPEPLPPPREPTPEPPPPPPPEPIYRPPIIQEVITHHRHIDHGIERARSPTPPPAPAPPSPPKEEDLEISIRRQGTRNGKNYDEEITFERDVHEHNNDRQVGLPDRSRNVSRDVGRHRSMGPPQRRYDDDVSSEADYYNRRITSRGYNGEAWNGATKDWGLVDIPPGTERVEMDGAGGGRQELTWGRYDGNRRNKSYTGDRAYDEGYGNSSPAPAPLPPPERMRGGGEDINIHEHSRNEDINIHISNQRGNDAPAAPAAPRRRAKDRMWTEVAKDLVIKEAIDEKGYEYEETDEFWYVMQYLQYEDVLKLVEISEDIRRQRRDRIRELQYERQSDRAPKSIMPPPPPPIPAPPRSRYEEKIHERDYYYDRERRGGGGYR